MPSHPKKWPSLPQHHEGDVMEWRCCAIALGAWIKIWRRQTTGDVSPHLLAIALAVWDLRVLLVAWYFSGVLSCTFSKYKGKHLVLLLVCQGSLACILAFLPSYNQGFIPETSLGTAAAGLLPEAALQATQEWADTNDVSCLLQLNSVTRDLFGPPGSHWTSALCVLLSPTAERVT